MGEDQTIGRQKWFNQILVKFKLLSNYALIKHKRVITNYFMTPKWKEFACFSCNSLLLNSLMSRMKDLAQIIVIYFKFYIHFLFFVYLFFSVFFQFFK